MEPNNRFDTGVGIALKNKYAKYIHNIYPYNDRIMLIHFKFAVDTFVLIIYAPTAEAEVCVKDEFYKQVNEITNKFKNKGVLYIMGDFNARIQIRQDETETAIGPHTFDKHNDKNLTGQSKGAIDNRQRFVAFC